MTSARTVAIQDQVLAVLRDEWPLPISTIQLCERVGASRYSDVGRIAYRVLNRLAKRGQVERIRLDGHYSVYWRGAA